MANSKNNIPITDPERQLPAGAYVLRIIAADYIPDKDYIRIVWDVADGEYANHFANHNLCDGNDVKSHCIYLTYDHKRRSWYTRSRQFNACVSEDKPSIPYNFVETFSPQTGIAYLSEFVGSLFGAFVSPSVYHSEASNRDFYQTQVDTYTTANLVRLGVFTQGMIQHV